MKKIVPILWDIMYYKYSNLAMSINTWAGPGRIGTGTTMTCSTRTRGHAVTEFLPCDNNYSRAPL